MHNIIQQLFTLLFDAVSMSCLYFSKPSTYLSLQCHSLRVYLQCSVWCLGVMYCDPQGVAHVMIQSFQLSSCTLCSAPIQDVSETPVCDLMPPQI